MKKLFWVLPFFCMSAVAQNNSLNLQLPSGPTSYQSDKFRAGDLDCSNAIGGGTNIEVGVTGIINDVDDPLMAIIRSVSKEKTSVFMHVLSSRWMARKSESTATRCIS